MSLFDKTPSIPELRPKFNVKGGFNLLNGTYHFGKGGESILNGGLTAINSVVGPGNSFKTVISLFLNLCVLETIGKYLLSIYDTETSLEYPRVNGLSKKFKKLSIIEHGDPRLTADEVRVQITSSAEIMGDVYFNFVIEAAKEKTSAKKVDYLTLPLIDHEGEYIKIITPTGVLIDSLSEFKVTAVEEKIVGKNSLGESGMNMYFMRQGMVKKHLITQLPNLNAIHGMFFTLTAHIGDEFEDISGMAPKKHKLAFAKRGSETKGVSPAFDFINNAIYEIFSVDILFHKDSSGYRNGALYPSNDSDKESTCSDLMKITLKLTRNKGGPTGAVLDLVVSQREGVLPHLGQFHYIKENNRYGLQGNLQNYSLVLCPEVKLSRTTVRKAIDENSNLRRAIEITSELLQIRNLWAMLPDDLMCTPEELYEDIKALGYDWEVLLNTRDYYLPIECEEGELPFLSTMDLLRLRKGLYKPYFL